MKSAFEKLLRTRPLVWLAYAFILGLLAVCWGSYALYLAPFLLIAGLGLLFWKRAPALAGILLIGLALGVLRYAIYTTRSSNDISYWITPAPVTVTGTIAGEPENRPGRLTFLLDAQQVDGLSGPEHVTGSAYVSMYAYAYEGAPHFNEGDRVALDGILQTPPDATNPGGFSWRDYLARRAVWCQMRVKRPGAVRLLGYSQANPWLLASSRARDSLMHSMRSGLAPNDSAVLSGILLGRRAELPPALMADFVSTGTVHILATAGLHVGIVSLILMGLFARITIPRKLAAILMIGTLWLYALMAGGRPSVTRAAFMASVYFGALLFERAPDLLTSLAAAALVILWLQPTAILEPAFQMSFATVLGLIVLMPIWTEFWAERWKTLRRKWQRVSLNRADELVGLSFFAQLAAAPVVALAYNQVSVLGFFANLCVVPSLFVLIPAGFLAALIGVVSTPAAAPLFKLVVAPVLHYIVATVTYFANLPGCSYSVRTLPVAAIVGFYGLLLGGAVGLKELANRRAGSQTSRSGAVSTGLPLAVEYESD
jgi:competence protein ComEC